MIKFGISRNYVSNWSLVQAIREIYQNFIDYGEFETDIQDKGDYSVVKLTNNFQPKSWEFLKIGFSKKDGHAIGEHGEGLKLAGLIFARESHDFNIKCCLGEAFPVFYEDENIGESFGLDIIDNFSERFEVCFTANNEDLKFFEEGYIKPEDILHKSLYGNIVNKKVGNIYVGGLFVCYLNNLKHSFDFNTQYVRLGRDRDVPSTLDMEYYMNLIVNNCSSELNLKASDIHSRELSYGFIPDKIAEKFKPVLDNSGNMYLESGKTKVSDVSMINNIIKHPIVAKRVQRLKYKISFIRNKTPHTILTELRKEISLSSSEKVRYDSVLNISKNWKYKL